MTGPVRSNDNRNSRITVVPESSFSPEIRGARQALFASAAQKQRNLQLLRQHIGQADFYQQMARVDPQSGGEWRRMVGMQAQFQRGESSYDSATRTYSESMRESLHRVAIELYRRQPPGQIFPHFMAIHGSLFNANSALQINGGAVLHNTNFTEVGRNFMELSAGIFGTNNYAPIANQAAEETRIARERRRLPITPR